MYIFIYLSHSLARIYTHLRAGHVLAPADHLPVYSRKHTHTKLSKRSPLLLVFPFRSVCCQSDIRTEVLVTSWHPLNVYQY